jgi:hypothetical protein
MDVKIPADIASGDYLLRAEALALHTAGQAGGARTFIPFFPLLPPFLWGSQFSPRGRYTLLPRCLPDPPS